MSDRDDSTPMMSPSTHGPSEDAVAPSPPAVPERITEDRLWRDDGWTAKVIKNEDDDGWAVAMTRDGDPEPALVGPWTMGRDKKNPKPLDGHAFTVLVKTAREFIMRAEQQRRMALHRSLTTSVGEDRVRFDLDIVPDEDDPHAVLTAVDLDRGGAVIARERVAANYKLAEKALLRWAENGYRQLGER